MDFDDFVAEPAAAPPSPARKRATGGDPPPGSGILSPSEQAASDAMERDPGVKAELMGEVAALRQRLKKNPADAEASMKLAILTDPKQNGTALLKGKAPASLDFDTFTGKADPQAREALEKSNKEELFAALFGRQSDWTLKNLAKETARNGVSIGDLVLSIPAQLIGVGGDMGMRARGIGEGKSHKETSQMGVGASNVIAEELGNPLAKLMLLAGMGDKGDAPTAVDAAMNRLTSLIEKGGEWVEEHTGGAINKEDVQSLTNVFMAAAGGQGLSAGVKRVVPKALAIEGVKLSPESLRRLERENLQQQEPGKAAQVAEQRATEAVEPIRAPRTGSTEAKTLSLDPITGKLSEPIPEMGKGLPEVTTLERAMEKVTNGRAFDMTAEERIAYNGWKKLPPPEPLINEAGQPLGKGTRWTIDENGRLMAVGAGGAAAAYLLDPEDQHDAVLATAGAFLARRGDGRGLSLEEFKKLDPAIPLGALLQRSDYTMKTLDRLDQGKIEFSKAHIEQELKRQDVTDPERAAIKAALDAFPGTKISARDLLVGVKEAVGDFVLEAKKVDDYADYGFENIDRSSWEPDQDALWDLRRQVEDTQTEINEALAEGRPTGLLDERMRQLEEALAPPPEKTHFDAKTTLYRLPEHMEVSDQNHFGDPNLFGWTRSFMEDGVRHVVEIQSDLAQHAKGLAPEERARIERELVGAKEAERSAKERWHEALRPYTQARADFYAGRLVPAEYAHIRDRAVDAQNIHRSATLTVSELEAKLQVGTELEKLAPILKNWPKRLVREELANVRQGAEKAENLARTYEAQIESFRLQRDEDIMRAPVASKASLHNNWKTAINDLQERVADLRKKAEQKSVRFATADTVAKVEGWPENLRDPEAAARAHEASAAEYRAANNEQLARRYEAAAKAAREGGPRTRFRPEHQSIYDRYQRDIEKFLKQLGGAEVKDAKGHTWIEVPLPKKGPTQMYGQAALAAGAAAAYALSDDADPKTLAAGALLFGKTRKGGQYGAVKPEMMARLAAVGLGAWAAQYYSSEHSLMDAVIGGAGAAVLSSISPGKAIANLRKLAAPDPRIKINEISDLHEKVTKLAAIDTWGLQQQIEELVPKASRREAITKALENGTVKDLSPDEQKAAKIFKQMYDTKLLEALGANAVRSGREVFLQRMWDWSANSKEAVSKWLDEVNQGEDTIPTIAEGKARGFTPLTEDLSQIMGIYGNALSRAIANKHFVEALKHEMTPAAGPEGPARPIPLVTSSAKAPHSYVSINTPAFTGLKVHPDIAPSVKMIFDTSQPGAAMKIMQGLSDTTKRIAVSFSLFHAKALTDAMIGGSTNPFKAITNIPGFVKGTNRYLLELSKGSASPLINRAVESGLVFSLERAANAVEDVGNGFYSSLKWAQGALDRAIPGGGLPLKGIAELNHKMDNFMWARLHAGMKLEMFAEKYQQLLDNSAKKGTALTPEQAGRIAASYTNDLFGGLNWRRIADDATTRFGRDLGHAVLNPGARRVNQLLLFAPDWTLSTTRAAVQAFSGRPDFLKPTTLAGLHQQYLLRSALYYLIVGDAINYASSGHHLWENKDPTMIDLDPKGERRMQWSKHTMEPVHWLQKPGQQALNKLGFIPKEALTQALKVEYLSTAGKSPPMDGRAKHLLKNFSPIAVQQGQQGGAAAAISGFAGAPIYGRTAAQKEKFKAEQAAKREKERAKK